jgi:hypothetical protein
MKMFLSSRQNCNILIKETGTEKFVKQKDEERKV